MSNTTYDIPVTVTGVNAPSVNLVDDDAEGRTFELVSTVSGDEAKIYGSADGVNFPPISNTTPLLTLGGNSPPRTLTDRSLAYRAVFTGSGARSLKVRAGTCCTGDPGQRFQTLALGNFAAGGAIGAATATVDQFAAFTIAQTTVGQTLSLPTPTDPTATVVRWVSNIGTASFIMEGVTLLPGSASSFVWNGSAWVSLIATGLAPSFYFASHVTGAVPTIAIDAPFPFDVDGPNFGTSITRIDGFTFDLVPGTYDIGAQMSVAEAGQAAIVTSIDGGATYLRYDPSGAGRATGTSQIVLMTGLTTTAASTRIQVWNSSSAAALTQTPTAGGTKATNISLRIVRLR